ncbi:MAG: hypothetical protein KIS92_26600 [Planctomycetota bacterium]|nr:hypothetical protein [Planctomycetota bacterium]
MAIPAPPTKSPPAFPANEQYAGQSCSICQTAVIAGEQMLTCPHCALPFHAECWAENRGCSAYGCKGAPPTVKSAETQPVSNAWGEEKPCPSCGKSIKAEALKCRFCGANFDTRDVITRKDYESREYEGTEYNAARNKVVMMFLLSAAACLAPLGLILCSMLIFNKSLAGVQYSRLPMTLKAVLWCGLGVGSLLVFLFLLLVAFDR